MKPKNSDTCPVCNRKSLEGMNKAPEDREISWIRCDVCRQWYHSVCLSLSASRLGQLLAFHCPECENEHGPSQLKRQLKRAKIKIDYVALDQGETYAVDKSVHPHMPNFLSFEPTVNFSKRGKPQNFVDTLKSHELTKQYVLSTGLSRPVMIHDVTAESGLELPAPRDEITVAYVSERAGGDAQVEVMDVLSQQSELPRWTLRQWKEYFYTAESERDRIRNVISLEVSQVDGLGTTFKRPHMVAGLDLVDKTWCDVDGHDQKRPKVTVYCLMSVKGSYTDFHIDFSGTPVYYTVCHGAKTFLMYPPTSENLALYESWCLEPHQNFTWFAEYLRRIKGMKIKPSNGFKVDLKQGDLFIIPSGWIHSVYTPEDAVIIGGNYLTLCDLPMHLTIYDIEKRTRVPSKYRFPMFNKVMWLTSWYYFKHQDEFLRDLGDFETSESHLCVGAEKSQPELGSMSSVQAHTKSRVDQTPLKEECLNSEPIKEETTVESSKADIPVKNENVHEDANTSIPLLKLNGNPSPIQPEHSRPHIVLQALITHLKQHYETSKTQPIAKKSIPTRLIGRNVTKYISNLEVWLEKL